MVSTFASVLAITFHSPGSTEWEGKRWSVVRECGVLAPNDYQRSVITSLLNPCLWNVGYNPVRGPTRNCLIHLLNHQNQMNK